MTPNKFGVKMMKKLYISLTVAVLVLLTVFIFIKETGNKSQFYAEEAFKTIEADDFSEEIYIYSTIQKDQEDKFQSLWGSVITYLDMRSNNPIISYDKDGSKKEERQTDNGSIFVDFTKTERTDSFDIYVNISTSDNTINLEKYMAQLEIIFNAERLKNEVTLSIKGSKIGRLNNEDIFNIKSMLLKNYNASLVSEFKEENVYSLTAYSKDLGRFVRVGGKKVNLNFAVRYSEVEDKSYIYLANPVIRTEI